MKSDCLSLMIKILLVLIALISTCIFFVKEVSILLHEEYAHNNCDISKQITAILANKINYDIKTLEAISKFISG